MALSWSALCCCSATEYTDSAQAADALSGTPGHYLDEIKLAAGEDTAAKFGSDLLLYIYAAGRLFQIAGACWPSLPAKKLCFLLTAAIYSASWTTLAAASSRQFCQIQQ